MDDSTRATGTTGSVGAALMSKAGYATALEAYDAAVCGAVAVSQAIAGRMVAPHVGYAAKVFTRICGHGIALIRATPRSRWVKSDSEFWDFISIAGHCRALLEGQLLLWYVIRPPESPEEWSARLNVMHLNDCCQRIKVLSYIESADVAGLSAQAKELRERLQQNRWFLKLSPKLQRRLLTGDWLAVSARDEQLAEAGWKKKDFYVLWHFLSQYIHVLPMSFYRIEPNGRGTGIENETDRGYICWMLNDSASIVTACVDRMIQEFPDAAAVRKGVESEFSPGPASNRHKP
jgi:hypothetical protein